MHWADYSLLGHRAVLATMHRKEEVILPALAELGLAIEVPQDFDTDRFGTFSREVPRAGSQLDAARAKINGAFERIPDAKVGIASEGSFGPDPFLPFVALGRELILLIDRDNGFELAGHHASFETNFGTMVVTDVGSALKFAERRKFPSHGIIVSAAIDGQPDPHAGLYKNLVDTDQIAAVVSTMIERHSAAFIETDMRANRNPTRMRSVEQAAFDLARRFNSRCPDCQYPGYDVTGRVVGLPCSWCGEPTRITRLVVLSCSACGYQEERPAGHQTTADPGQCEHCNP
jgi:hypothetical protein